MNLSKRNQNRPVRRLRAACAWLPALALIVASAGCADDSPTSSSGDDTATLEDISDSSGGTDVETTGDTTGGDTTEPGDATDTTTTTDATDTVDPGDATDAGDTGDTIDDADTTPACADTGASCANGAACCEMNATCATDDTGSWCAPSCTSDVQCNDYPGTVCRRESTTPGSPMLCLAAVAVQCETCASDNDCPGTSNRCVDLENTGQGYCLEGCMTDTDCDGLSTGTTCSPHVIEGQFGDVTVNLCTPAGSACVCNDPDSDGYGTGPSCPQTGDDCAPMDPNRNPDATEICNGLDDNCDTMVDEGFDTLTDVDNCGACGNVCSATGGTPSCVDGACQTSCTGALADCDADPTTCETDTDTDTLNCGGCGMACSAGAGVSSMACNAGQCEITACVGNFADCDGDPSNGCEVDLASDTGNCGSCGQVCNVTGGSPVCANSTCIASCSGTRADCDADPTTCEVDLAISTDHCQACNNACVGDATTASVSCGPTGCRVASCTGTLADCDANFANGCEVDLASDTSNCQSCGNLCYFGQNTIAQCGAGGCINGGCTAGFYDCDGNTMNGCESSSACLCSPGQTQSCWTGDPNKRGVGLCADGMQTCTSNGLGWGPCNGQTLPTTEICANGLDEDCTGTADDVGDIDGDGYTRCQMDCCETQADGCSEPIKVNPAAIDDPTNSLDDDCDGTIDNPPVTTCSTSSNFNSPTAQQMAGAMELCKVYDPANPTWGLVSATLYKGLVGTADPQFDFAAGLSPLQYSIMTSFGSNVFPQGNTTMGVLSSGTARAAANTGYLNPDGTGFQDATNEGQAPSDYLAAHGGQLQTTGTCPNGDPEVHDVAALHVQLKVPSNAQGFSYNFKFYSAEYPEWVCDSYNDFFLAMLYSNAPGIPADKNISFDANNNPVSVNNAFFEVCSGCPSGTWDLVGTGYPETDAGGTNWLTTSAPVVPGEIIDLYFIIWDTGDHAWDSLVLLDNFQWSLDPTTVFTE